MRQHKQPSFDEQLKQINDLDTPPPGIVRDPAATWGRISTELDRRQKRRGGWIWWSTAAGLVLTLGLAWAFLPGPEVPDGSLASGVHSPDTTRPQATPDTGALATIADSNGVIKFSVEEAPVEIVEPEPDPVFIVYSEAGKASHQVEEVTIVGKAIRAEKSMSMASMTVTTKGLSRRKGRKSGGKKTKRRTKRSRYAVSPDQQQGFFKRLFSRKPQPVDPENPNSTEEYQKINERDFVKSTVEPLSTFSIDVDKAAYANTRRKLKGGTLPPPDAVRTEEMVNYFDYEYPVPGPNSPHPFSVNTEVGDCPWDRKHQLVHIGIQGQDIAASELPTHNLVFLLDVSGSMNSGDKLPLLKQSFGLLVDQLRPQDHVSIVVYAGAAGVVLEPTPGDQKETILAALNRLEAGGSTAGGAGIELAYQLAEKHFDKKGNNRIVLATDGDFNVGVASENGLEKLIEKKRATGIFLTVLGLGQGNYKDARMETLADKGNGNFFCIDQLNEAKKVFVQELSGTLFTIAKDVKIQVEFNPAAVQAYRLIGYENRALRNEDFKNDKVDAGELGAGHTVTALYEVIPASGKPLTPEEELRYQKPTLSATGRESGEMLEVRLRYKRPEGRKSIPIVQPVLNRSQELARTSDNFRWSAAVASFSLILRGSQYKGNFDYKKVRKLAETAADKDPFGYRAEFLDLIDRAEALDNRSAAQK